MITVVRNHEGQITEVTSEYRTDGENRNDWKTFAVVQEVAAEVTTFTKATYIAVDNGPHCYPRFDVARLPAVGDEVSYAFNGDSYTCGKIASVSKTFKLITTTEGQKFYRRRSRASWIMDGTWSLVQGHIYEQNPSF